MGGYGDCPCCKQWKELTEHNVKDLDMKLMLCPDCHNVIEEYTKVRDRLSKSVFSAISSTANALT